MLQETSMGITDHSRLETIKNFLDNTDWGYLLPKKNTQTGSRGVGILYRKHAVQCLNHQDTNTTVFNELNNNILIDRIQAATFNMNGHIIKILNIYAPATTTENCLFTNSITELLTIDNTYSEHIIGGDWNNIAHQIDHAGKDNAEIQIHQVLLESQTHLTDSFRLRHPNTRIATNAVKDKNGNLRDIRRRIDRIYTPPSVTPMIAEARVLPLKSHSHQVIYLSLRFGNTKTPKRNKQSFRMSPDELLNDKTAKMLDTHLRLMVERRPSCPILTINLIKQEAARMLQNYVCIPRARALRRQAKDDSELMEQMEINNLRSRTAHSSRTYWPDQQNIHVIKARVKKMASETSFVKLEDEQGNTDSSLEHLHKVVTNYYEKLFQKKPVDLEILTSFLDHIPPEQKLNEHQKATTEAPITLDDITDAIRNTPNNSAPGPDGLPYEFYKRFHHILAPLLVEIVAAIDKGDSFEKMEHLFPGVANTSLIRLLEKEKTPKDIRKFRPIALTNTDSKIISYAINKRIIANSSTIIHSDQTGFIPKRVAQTNLETLDHFYYSYPNNRAPWILACIDFEKAYDTISHSSLMTTLEAFNFGTITTNRARALQTKASARFIVNNTYTDKIPLARGVRQGDPSSPILFSIILEPLLCAFRNRLQGLHRPGIQRHPLLKVKAFADDICLYLKDSDDLMVTGQLLTSFSTATGLTINGTKTTIQPVTKLKNDNFTKYDGDLSTALSVWQPMPTQQQPGTLYKYLGVQHGDPSKVAEKTTEWVNETILMIRKLALHGMSTFAKAWCVNTFVYSKLIFRAPFNQPTSKELDEIHNTACNKVRYINIPSSTHSDNIDNPTPTHSAAAVLAPPHLGGYGLWDIRDKLEIERVKRVIRIMTVTTKNDTLVSMSPPSEVLIDIMNYVIGAKRKSQDVRTLWVEGRNIYVYLASSANLRSCLESYDRKLFKERRHLQPSDSRLTRGETRLLTPDMIPLSLHIGDPSSDDIIIQMNLGLSWVNDKDVVTRLDSKAEINTVMTPPQAINRAFPNMTKSPTPFFKHFFIWTGLPIQLAAAHAALNTNIDNRVACHEEAKTLEKILKGLTGLYLKNPKVAETFHQYLGGKLGFIRGDWLLSKPNSPFVYKDGGCGICQTPDTKELMPRGLQTHMFNNCLVAKTVLEEAGISPVNHSYQYFHESATPKPEGLLIDNNLPEIHLAKSKKPYLIYAIWQMERSLRRAPLDMTDPVNVKLHATKVQDTMFRMFDDDEKRAILRRAGGLHVPEPENTRHQAEEEEPLILFSNQAVD